MAEKKTRKTDRRTLYTRMVIKDALPSLPAEKAYADIGKRYHRVSSIRHV
jgi:hypothetical protein